MAVKLRASDLSDEDRQLLVKRCTFKEKKGPFTQNPTTHTALALTKGGDVYIPIGLYPYYFGEDFPRDEDDYPPISRKARFTKTLLTAETDSRGRDQSVVIEEALESLRVRHTVFLECFTGFGKTAMGVYLTVALGKKTAIIVNATVIREQWPSEFEKYSKRVKVQYIESSSTELDPDSDVYIFGVVIASKFKRRALRDIGTVIVDEAHTSTVKCFTNVLLRFTPYYLVCLSATPDRSDGLESLMCVYCPRGDEHLKKAPKKRKRKTRTSAPGWIMRKETKEFRVVKYKTHFKPKIEYCILPGGGTGVKWSTVVSSLETNPERLRCIVSLVKRHPNNKILVMSKSKNQSRALYTLLKEEGENVRLLIENMNITPDVLQSRVLVAGINKASYGFNDPSRDVGIFASSVKDVRQMEGRIRATNNIIYDIVDDFKSLERHYSLRKAWYLSKGATIEIERADGGVADAKDEEVERGRDREDVLGDV